MAFKLTTYQNEHCQELLEDAKRLLKIGDGKKLVFKAPTGSGKTIMMAEFLTRFADDKRHEPCSFIWTAPRQLHEQSKEKIEQYFEKTRAVECSYFEDLTDRQIDENEVLFFNWESIRQDGNIYIRDNEQDNNLSNVIERTREAGRKIVLVIDESHFHAQAETSQNLIGAIKPDLTIEVSATPIMQNPDKIVSVDLSEVKKEEMIKKAVILNENFKNVVKDGTNIKSELANSTDEIVLREALKKREELVKKYKASGINVNPLLLIQLPDRRGQGDDDRQEMLVRILDDKHGINRKNGKLAFYLAEDKENSENIKRNDSEVEVLIFKQAIALGWDCPRAQILVLFREWSSPVFSIQTIGRIMRVPEPEIGYYKEDILNYAYVYTNLDNIEVKEDIGRDYVVIHISKRAEKYKSIHLQSVHSKRHREQTRLSPLFTSLFLEKNKEFGLAKKIKTKNQRVQPALISDWKTENIDVIAGKQIVADVRIDTASDRDLQRLFDYFIYRNLMPEFHPEDRSVGRLKESIYQFFDSELGMAKLNQFQEIINIVLSDENKPHFETVINEAKIAYQSATEKREKELVEEEWEVPERVTFGDEYEETESKKSIMEPFYSNKRWQSEKSFIEFLDRPSNQVEWWFKNGERDATFFAVPYKNGDEQLPFYVDFVVKMKDGRIGLFDPHGTHLADFPAKSDGLLSYIKKSGKKLFGGIIANTDPDKYTGQWMIYTGDGRNIVQGDWKGWERLEL